MEFVIVKIIIINIIIIIILTVLMNMLSVMMFIIASGMNDWKSMEWLEWYQLG
jgi:hypothetical protein